MMVKSENAKQRRTVYKVVSPNRTSLAVRDDNELFYPEYEVVEADPKSMGIFVFNTQKSAQRYIESHGRLGQCRVLRAEPLSRGYVPSEIHSVRHGGFIWWDVITAVPAGTMCYHKIRVLD